VVAPVVGAGDGSVVAGEPVGAGLGAEVVGFKLVGATMVGLGLGLLVTDTPRFTAPLIRLALAVKLPSPDSRAHMPTLYAKWVHPGAPPQRLQQSLKLVATREISSPMKATPGLYSQVPAQRRTASARCQAMSVRGQEGRVAVVGSTHATSQERTGPERVMYMPPVMSWELTDSIATADTAVANVI